MYKPIEVTDEQVLKTLREVVAENPDFVYHKQRHQGFFMRCLYVHNKDTHPSCGCVVGHVLHRLGVPLEELSKLELNPANVLVDRYLRGTDWSEEILVDIQIHQDQGHSWGQALKIAENYFAERQERQKRGF